MRRRRARVRRERVRRGVLHAEERIDRPIEDTLVPLRGILRAVTAVLLGGGGAGRIAWRRDAAQQVDGGDLNRRSARFVLVLILLARDELAGSWVLSLECHIIVHEDAVDKDLLVVDLVSAEFLSLNDSFLFDMHLCDLAIPRGEHTCLAYADIGDCGSLLDRVNVLNQDFVLLQLTDRKSHGDLSRQRQALANDDHKQDDTEDVDAGNVDKRLGSQQVLFAKATHEEAEDCSDEHDGDADEKFHLNIQN